MLSENDGRQEKNSNEATGVQETLEEFTRKIAVLEKEIEDSSSHMQIESKDLEKEADRVESSISGELQVVNNVTLAFRKSAEKIKENIVGAAYGFNYDVNNLVKEIEKWSFYIFVVGLLIVAGRAAFLLFQMLVFPFDPALISGVLLLLCVTAAVNLTLRSTHKKFENYENKIRQNGQKAFEEAIAFISTPLQLKTDPRQVKTKLSTFLSDFNRAISAVAHFVSHFREYYEWKSKLNKIQIFAQSIRNSMQNFGLTLDSEAETYLKEYCPKEESVDEWLTETSGRLSKQLDVPNSVVSLAYYEYTDNVEGKCNEWSKVLANQESLIALTKVLCKGRIVDVEYLDVNQASDSQAFQRMLKQIQSFSLEEFKEIYMAFYTELTDHKKALVSALVEYGVTMEDTVRKELLKSVPKKPDKQQWTSELLDTASKLLSLQIEIIELIYFDRVGDYGRRREAWEHIKKNSSLEELVKFLIDHRQLMVPSYYIKSKELEKFVGQEIALNDDYSLLNITRQISEDFSELDNTKKLLLQAVEYYSAPLFEEDKYEFQSFLPLTGSLLEAMIEHVGQRLGINGEIVRLFYLNYVQKEVDAKSLFQDIKESELTMELANLLIQRNKIQRPKERKTIVSDFATILRSMDRFDLMTSQQLLNKYYDLMSYYEQMTEFALNEKLTDKKHELQIETLLKTVHEKTQNETFEQLKILIEYLIKADSVSSVPFNSQDFGEVIVAVAALFLWRITDVNREKAYKQASQLDVASKILYQYMTVNETKIGQQTISLRQVIQQVIGQESSSYEYLAEFRHRLANGIMTTSRQELITASLDEIKQKMAAKIEEYKEAFSDLQEDIRNVFSTELALNSVTLLLNSSIVSAYLITTNQKGPIISGIIDGTLPECCREFAMNDPIFSRFLMLETESKAIGGFYTRTGLVPLGMSFKDFGDKFEILFKRAEQSYKDLNPQDTSEKFSVNLLRIIPSEAAFRAIGIADTVVPALVKTVHKLMIEKLELIDNFEFLVSLAGEEPKMKLKKLVTTAIDSQATVYSLTKAEVGHIASKHPNLKKSMEDKTFDKELMQKHDCKTLSELAIAVHKTRDRYEDEKKGGYEEQFSKVIAEIVSHIKGRLEQEEMKMLSELIMGKLDKFGVILTL